METVSVIIPTYNRATLVVETIETVLSQDYPRIEVVVVDDGSTDDTLTVLKKYSDRIRLVSQENKGVNSARNHGLNLTTGEYVALLDSDDLWLPETVSRLSAILDENPSVGFAFCDFKVFRPDGTYKPNGLGAWYLNSGGPAEALDRCPVPGQTGNSTANHSAKPAGIYTGDIYKASLYHPCVLPSASLYRRSLAKTVPALPEFDSTCGDWEFFARLSHMHGAAYLDWHGAINRSHEDEVRLTRLDESIQFERRIALIERTWFKDPQFMLKHKREVQDVLYEVHCDLMRAYLVAGKSSAAQQLATRYAAVNHDYKDYRLRFLRQLAAFPAIDHMLPSVRRIYHRVRPLLDRVLSTRT